MTSIKKMTGTDNFLAWPENKRQCALEQYEECKIKVFLEETVKCGCSPFELLPAIGNTSEQVHILKFKLHISNQVCRLDIYLI